MQQQQQQATTAQQQATPSEQHVTPAPPWWAPQSLPPPPTTVLPGNQIHGDPPVAPAVPNAGVAAEVPDAGVHTIGAVPEATHTAVHEATHTAVPEATHATVPEATHAALPEATHPVILTPAPAYDAMHGRGSQNTERKCRRCNQYQYTSKGWCNNCGYGNKKAHDRSAPSYWRQGQNAQQAQGSSWRPQATGNAQQAQSSSWSQQATGNAQQSWRTYAPKAKPKPKPKAMPTMINGWITADSVAANAGSTTIATDPATCEASTAARAYSYTSKELSCVVKCCCHWDSNPRCSDDCRCLAEKLSPFL